MIREVVVTSLAAKQLRKVPTHIAEKFQLWVEAVKVSGLEAVRKIPGFHDEPLKGDRAGQRSIRLNRSYRAIYVIRNGEALFVSVEEVTNHKY